MAEPEASVSPRAASAGAAGPVKDKNEVVGKSSHLNVVKSMSLLHELQTYVVSIENLAAQRHVDLQRLLEEKQELEKMSKTMTLQLYRQSAAPGVSTVNLSNATEDLPPKERAALGDVKVLKERVRKYKEQVSGQEKSLKKQQDQIEALTAQLAAAKAGAPPPAEPAADAPQADSLPAEGGAEGGAAAATPAKPPSATKLAEQLAHRELTIKDLEHKLTVVAKSRESDARKHRGELAEAAKKQQAQRAEADALRAQLEEKDRELRGEVLRMRELRQQLAPPRPRSTAGHGERRLSSRGSGAPADTAPIVLMCIVIEETGPTREQLAAAEAEREAADEAAAAAAEPEMAAPEVVAEFLEQLIDAAVDAGQDGELRALKEEIGELREDNDALRGRLEVAEAKVAEYEASEPTGAEGAATDPAAAETAEKTAASAESTKKPGAARGARPAARAGGGYTAAAKPAPSPAPSVAAKKAAVPKK